MTAPGMMPGMYMAQGADTRQYRMATMWTIWWTGICIIFMRGIATIMGQSKQPDSDKGVQQRNTRQKAAIREVFLAMDRPLGPQEVLEHAGSRKTGLGIATVYRNIKSLVEEGWLTPVGLPGEPDRYEVAGKAHHHHFHCERCQKVFDLPGCPVQLKASLPEGYVSTRHELVLYGKCPSCSGG
jgi:Fur family ferric uptake transcriptional regulator